MKIHRPIWICLSFFVFVGCGGGGGGGSDPCEALKGVPGKLINGATCNISYSPVVVVVTRTRRGENFCSGTVISRSLILTAAHCMDGYRGWPTVISSNGVTDRTTGAYSPQGWFDGNRSPAFDAALLTVDPSFVAAAGITPMRVSVSPRLAVGDRVTVAGYGVNETGELPANLTPRAAFMEVAHLGYGQIDAVFDEEFQSGTCRGDSGGPAILEVNGEHAIVGIVSQGDPDCAGSTALGDTSNPSIADMIRWADNSAVIED